MSRTLLTLPLLLLTGALLSAKPADETPAAEAGVGTGLHYAPAVHAQPPFAGGDEAEAVPLDNAVRWSEEVLSLPMFPELSEAEALRVVDVLENAIEEMR